MTDGPAGNIQCINCARLINQHHTPPVARILWVARHCACLENIGGPYETLTDIHWCRYFQPAPGVGVRA